MDVPTRSTMADENEYDVKPPWIKYPNSDPVWGGWRQGVSEAWLLGTWLPFWRGLQPEERRKYLATFPPPDEEWDFYLNVAWLR
jgi:hypothetical protein